VRYNLKSRKGLKFVHDNEYISIVDGDYDGWHASYSCKIKTKYLPQSIPFWINVDNKPHLIVEVGVEK
jgi:hypothetical protein